MKTKKEKLWGVSVICCYCTNLATLRSHPHPLPHPYGVQGPLRKCCHQPRFTDDVTRLREIKQCVRGHTGENSGGMPTGPPFGGHVAEKPLSPDSAHSRKRIILERRLGSPGEGAGLTMSQGEPLTGILPHSPGAPGGTKEAHTRRQPRPRPAYQRPGPAPTGHGSALPKGWAGNLTSSQGLCRSPRPTRERPSESETSRYKAWGLHRPALGFWPAARGSLGAGEGSVRGSQTGLWATATRGRERRRGPRSAPPPPRAPAAVT